MATSSFTCLSSFVIVNNNNKSYSFQQSAFSCLKNVKECSAVGRNLRSASRRRRSNKGLIVRNATPEVADAVSSISIPGFPGLSLPGDNPWLTGAAGLFLVVPFVIQRLLTLTKEVDVAAQTIEKIADTVGKVAKEVDKAAEEMVEKLPDGGLKKVASMVEHLAEETVKDAQKVEDLMDKIEELDDKVEAFLNKQTKGPEKV